MRRVCSGSCRVTESAERNTHYIATSFIDVDWNPGSRLKFRGRERTPEFRLGGSLYFGESLQGQTPLFRVATQTTGTKYRNTHPLAPIFLVPHPRAPSTVPIYIDCRQRHYGETMERSYFTYSARVLSIVRASLASDNTKDELGLCAGL